MHDVKIGQLVTDPNQQRDAIHIAVAPAVAHEPLQPGQHVGRIHGDSFGASKSPLGIVDPFLKKKINQGERFFVFLYPNTITSLRHEWTHPEFADDAKKIIENMAHRCGITYETIMDAAAMWIETHDGKWGGEYLHMGEDERYKDAFDSTVFWENYEKVTGEKLSEDIRRSGFFSCSC